MRGLDGKRAIVDAVMQDLEDQISLTRHAGGRPARDPGGKGRGKGHRFFFAPRRSSTPASAPQRVLVGDRQHLHGRRSYEDHRNQRDRHGAGHLRWRQARPDVR